MKCRTKRWKKPLLFIINGKNVTHGWKRLKTMRLQWGKMFFHSLYSQWHAFSFPLHPFPGKLLKIIALINIEGQSSNLHTPGIQNLPTGVLITLLLTGIPLRSIAQVVLIIIMIIIINNILKNSSKSNEPYWSKLNNIIYLQSSSKWFAK